MKLRILRLGKFNILTKIYIISGTAFVPHFSPLEESRVVAEQDAAFCLVTRT